MQSAARVCAAAACRVSAARADAEQVQAAKRAEIEQLKIRRAARRKLSVSLQTYTAVVVPGNFDRMAPPSAARVRELRTHLEIIIGHAIADPCRAAADSPPWPQPAKADSLAFLQAASLSCGSCRGHCCETGSRTQAWLTADTIRRVRVAMPTATPEQITACYLEYLPSRSMDGSCVYHGNRGCTLPRDLRADVCNHYFCPPLKALRESQGPNTTVRAFIAVRVPSGRYRTRFVETVSPAPDGVSAA